MWSLVTIMRKCGPFELFRRIERENNLKEDTFRTIAKLLAQMEVMHEWKGVRSQQGNSQNCLLKSTSNSGV